MVLPRCPHSASNHRVQNCSKPLGGDEFGEDYDEPVVPPNLDLGAEGRPCGLLRAHDGGHGQFGTRRADVLQARPTDRSLAGERHRVSRCLRPGFGTVDLRIRFVRLGSDWPPCAQTTEDGCVPPGAPLDDSKRIGCDTVR